MKTSTFVFFLIKAYFFLAFVYFLFLLYRLNQSGAAGNVGGDLVSDALQALIWPKDLITYVLGGRK